MNKPKPKFCVGEEVMVRSIYAPQYNTDKTEVIAVRWQTGPVTGITGWFYQTASQPDLEKWWTERSLTKLPPDDRIQWSDCEWQPRNVYA